MANLNKVMLIGRLTKDPESRTLPSGAKVTEIRFAVNNRVKNQQTGQWEDKPVFLDVKAWDRETGRKLASLCADYLRKGHQCYIEGHLVLDEWNDKNTGDKRSVLRVIMEDVQFLEPKTDGQGGGMRSAAPARAAAPAASSGGYDEPEPMPSGGGGEDEIPF